MGHKTGEIPRDYFSEENTLMDLIEAIQRQCALQYAQDDLRQDSATPDAKAVSERAEIYAEFLLRKSKPS